MTVIGAESKLMRSADPAHVVCALCFNRIVVAGLDVHSGHGKPMGTRMAVARVPWLAGFGQRRTVAANHLLVHAVARFTRWPLPGACTIWALPRCHFKKMAA